MKLIILLLTLVFSAQTYAEVVTYSDAISGQLGQGYNKETESFTGHCLKKISVPYGTSEGQAGLISEVKTYELAKELGIGAGGRYRSGAATTKASAEFLRKTKSTGHSISVTYRANYDFKPHKLSRYEWTDLALPLLMPLDAAGKEVPIDHPDYESLKQTRQVKPINENVFRQKCGDGFIDSINLGAKFFYNIRIDFSSSKEMRSFKSKFSFTSPTVDLSANLKKEMQKISSRSKVTISALQIGGNIEKVSAIFGTDLMQDNNRAMATAQCQKGDFEKCFDLLANAIAYAADVDEGFPSQISATNGKPGDGGPDVLSGKVQSYLTHTNFINPYSQYRRLFIAELTKEVSEIFENILNDWVWARRIGSTNIPRLNETQEHDRQQVEVNAYNNLQSLVDIVETCYERPADCEELVGKIDLLAYKQNHKLYAQTLEFTPDRIAALCDLWQSGELLELNPERHKTVGAIISVVDRNTGSADDPYNPVREAKDFCAAAEQELLTVYELDLSGKGISDLSDLKYFTHIRKIDLSKNRITGDDLKTLAVMKNLVSLDLSNNRIIDPSHLAVQSQLRKLNLSNNKIRNADALREMKLHSLNLANNSSLLHCPFDQEDKCIMKDFSKFTSFNAVARSGYPRIGASLIDLNNSHLLIVGGYGRLPYELMSKKDFQLQQLDKYSQNRIGSSYIKIKDNDIFIIGGVDSVRSANASRLNFNASTFELKHQNVVSESDVISHQEAIKLQDGRVLITGGYEDRHVGIASAKAYIFDPNTNRVFKANNGMRTPRVDHQMVLLSDGRVLIVGGKTYEVGVGYKPINSIEVFNPSTESFSWFRDKLSVSRYGHTATLLKDGSILVTGGFDSIQDPELVKDSKSPIDEIDPETGESNGQPSAMPVRSAELIDPINEVVLSIDVPMIEARAFHKAILLENGDVAIFSGMNRDVNFKPDTKLCLNCLNSAEIYSTKHQTFTDVGERMIQGRVHFSLLPLNDKRILLMGGIGSASTSAELFEYSGL